MGRQRELALQKLRNKIVRGELKPGVLFSESKLADEFGISRTPVRQAIVMLSQEGFIEQYPQVGATVRRLSQEELAELITIRIAVESVTVAKLAELPGPKRLEGLEELLDRMDSCAKADDKVVFNEADAEFHRCIAANSRSSISESLLRSWGDRIRVLGLDALQLEGAMMIVNAEHRRIFEAIRAQDIEEAREAVKVHLEQAAKRIAAADPERFGTVHRLVSLGVPSRSSD